MLRSELEDALNLVSRHQMEVKKLAGELNEVNEALNAKCVELSDSGLVVKKLVCEKEELGVALESAETKIQLVETKLASALVEVANGKQEVDRVILDKNDEIKNLRYSFCLVNHYVGLLALLYIFI